MGRIVVSENVTLDGIMQDPTGDEGFKFGGWFEQMTDEVRAEWAEIEYQEAVNTEAWLTGRRTHEWFASRWATRPGPWADRLRAIPKYVVSATLDTASGWDNSIVLRGDVVEQATTLKQSVDGDIVVYGSGRLVRTLMEHELVDELRLMTFPFVLGTGERLFRETSDSTPLRLGSVRVIGGFLAHLIYQPARHG